MEGAGCLLDGIGAQDRLEYHISQCIGVTARLFFLGKLSLYPDLTHTWREGKGRRGGRVPSCEASESPFVDEEMTSWKSSNILLLSSNPTAGSDLCASHAFNSHRRGPYFSPSLQVVNFKDTEKVQTFAQVIPLHS